MKRKLLLVTLVPVVLVIYFIVAIGLAMHHAEIDNELIRAIKADKTEAVLAALQAGADPNIRDHRQHVNYWAILRGGSAQNRPLVEYYATPLQIALNVEIDYGMGPGPNHVHRENLPLIKALLDHGADPNDTVMLGTPSMRAAEWGYADTLKLLLDKGVDLNRTDAGGMTALHCAVMGMKPQCARILLEHGADPDKKNKMGQTPRQRAALSPNKEIQELLNTAKRKN